MTVSHIHSSGRYDRSPASLEKAFRSYTKKANVVTLTEVSREAREAALRRVCKTDGWDLITGDKGGMDDSSVLWDKADFTVVAKGTAAIGAPKAPGIAGEHGYAAWAVLESHDVKKHRLLVIAFHMARSVEGSKGWSSNLPWIRKWRAEQKSLRILWNKLSSQYNCSGILVSCDWNVNIKRKFFQAVFRRLQPGMKPALDYKNLPKRGTHGSRLIDFSFIRGKLKVVKRPVIMVDDDSSDHVPYREVFEFTE